MNCSASVRDEFAERYLLGQLSLAEQEAYERHYFECDRCFGELQTLQAIQQVLRSAPPALPAPRKAITRVPWWGWVTGGAVAASLVGVVLLQFRAHERLAGNPGAPAVATSRASPDTAATTSRQPVVAENEDAATAAPVSSLHESAERSGAASPRSEVLARLARVDPPTYLPRVLRGVADEATASFKQGMKAYVAGDYPGAKPQLRKASSLDPERPDIAFYLGASELMSGDTAGAVTEFQRVIAAGETPFLEEAHFYLAKTYLKQGEAARARTELATVIALNGDRTHEAEEMRAQLTRVGSE